MADSRPFRQSVQVRWKSLASPPNRIAASTAPAQRECGRRMALNDAVEALRLDAPRHAPAGVGADELVVVPEPAEQDLAVIEDELHRVEADDA